MLFRSQILFELRRQLYRSAQNDHDWASIVAYSTLPRDFNTQVAEFCSRQIKGAIKVLLDHADSIAATKDGEKLKERRPEIRSIISDVEEWLRTWRAREPKGNSAEDRLRRSDIIGMHGSTYKRVALLLASTEGRDNEETQRYYLKSLEHYRVTMLEAAAANINYYWCATQYLALQAIRKGSPEQDVYELARRLAGRDSKFGENDSTKAWAYATLAELEILRRYHAPSEATIDDIVKRVERYCSQVIALKGPRSFHVGSTLRQFKRYRDSWENDLWNVIVERAIEILAPSGFPEPEFDYPDDD